MNTKRKIILAALVLMLTASVPIGASDATPATPLLPAHSTWKLRWDTSLDGELKADEPGLSWEVDVCNHRIHVEGGKSVLSAEIVDGRFPIFTLRQDDAQGYVTFYSGKMTERRVIIGTWVNTWGQSGDFKIHIGEES